MFTTTRAAWGIPCKDAVCFRHQQVSKSPVSRQLKLRQLNSFSSTSRAERHVRAAMTKPAERRPSEAEESTGMAKFKWSGGVKLELNCELDAAWRLQADFLGLTSWVPTISECLLTEGEANLVGCLRYCKGTSQGTWVHERLLEFDAATHYMSYRMEDNHFVFRDGFQNYISKVQLGDAGEGKTWAKWTYEVDPVATQTKESLTAFMVEFYTQNLKYLETGANKLLAEANGAASSLKISAGP